MRRDGTLVMEKYGCNAALATTDTQQVYPHTLKFSWLDRPDECVCSSSKRSSGRLAISSSFITRVSVHRDACSFRILYIRYVRYVRVKGKEIRVEGRIWPRKYRARQMGTLRGGGGGKR